MVSDLYAFAVGNSLQEDAGVLPQLPYAYHVFHCVHMVAHSFREKTVSAPALDL